VYTRFDGAKLERRQVYTRFDEADAARLEGMSDTFERIAADLIEEFYDHLGAHEESVAMLDSSSKSPSGKS
jgi:heme-based aerotactic transducer